jgi:hypothetical protein
MRIQFIFFPFLLLILVIFQSCSKSVASGSNGNHDTTITTNPASKYIVDTYAGSKVPNSISQPGPMCVDDMGVLYVSETNHNVIMKIDPLIQSIAVFSGSFNQPGCMDDPLGSGSPSLVFPQTLWFSNDKLIFIGDYECTAKAATTTGQSSAIQYANPNYISVSPSGACKDFKGNIYLFDSFGGLYEIAAANNIISQIVNFSDLGIASSITMDGNDKNIYLAAKHQILQYADGKLSTIAGDSLGNQDGSGSKAEFGGTMAICLGQDGNIYVADTYNNSIRQVSPNGSVVTIAGDGKEGYLDGTGDKAEFYNPSGIAYSSIGGKNVLYVSDYYNNVIRRIILPN